jgi:LysR substrate binding domain
VLAEPIEQLVDKPSIDNSLTKQPDRGGVRHRILEPEVEKTHERQTVADHQLGLLVGQIVQALQHQNLELQDRVIRLAASLALALLWSRRSFNVGPKVLPRYRRLNRLQHIALGADRLQNVAVELETTPPMIELIERGTGYTVLPPSTIVTREGRIKAAPIRGFSVTWTLGLNRDRENWPAVRALATMIREQAKALISAGAWKKPIRR